MAFISIVGTGYVGLVTGACFADLGNRVRCIDIDVPKIERLRQGQVSIYEPGLQEVVQRNLEARRLTFHEDYEEGLKNCEFAFICVDTPDAGSGRPNLKPLESAVHSIVRALKSSAVLINKSTVPVGTGDWLAERLAREAPGAMMAASCPEFLREGSAVQDFLQPDRIVLGVPHRGVGDRIARLFAPMQTEILITDMRTAELIKFACNAYLATRISFVNHMAQVCEAVGVDVDGVARGMSLDTRIGNQFLNAGLGFGGSCFPKDVNALKYLVEACELDSGLLGAVLDLNQAARCWVIDRLRDAFDGDLRGCTIGLLGLSFKPNTDDLREAPAMDIVRALMAMGAVVKGYDPAALETAGARRPDLIAADSAYALADGTDAVVVCTEWNEFRHLDMREVAGRMKGRVLIDGRNIYDPDTMAELGFVYHGVGRGQVRPASVQGHA